MLQEKSLKHFSFFERMNRKHSYVVVTTAEMKEIQRASKLANVTSDRIGTRFGTSRILHMQTEYQSRNTPYGARRHARSPSQACQLNKKVNQTLGLLSSSHSFLLTNVKNSDVFFKPIRLVSFIGLASVFNDESEPFDPFH